MAETNAPATNAADANAPGAGRVRRIVVRKNGPYVVYGRVPLVRKTQVTSEYGEPLLWRKEGELETEETYLLCRCGQSGNKPFCDSTHKRIGFDGTETALTAATAERQIVYEQGTRIVVKRDFYLCVASGFCGNRITNIDAMLEHTGDPQVRAQVMSMIGHCPSGSYVFALDRESDAESEAESGDVEPDLPQQIAVTTAVTSAGPILGPLWVTGGIPIARADGQPFETRNRVTLCRCGLSGSKPLCDGSHRQIQPHSRP
jgi:CDGSH-type Zn-finger protein